MRATLCSLFLRLTHGATSIVRRLPLRPQSPHHRRTKSNDPLALTFCIIVVGCCLCSPSLPHNRRRRRRRIVGMSVEGGWRLLMRRAFDGVAIAYASAGAQCASRDYANVFIVSALANVLERRAKRKSSCVIEILLGSARVLFLCGCNANFFRHFALCNSKTKLAGDVNLAYVDCSLFVVARAGDR